MLPRGCARKLLFSVSLWTGLGCTNPPGALQMRLAPAHDTFRKGEPVRFAATFSSKKGLVAIERPNIERLDVGLTDLTTGETVPRVRFGKCGMEYAFLIPLYPVIFAGACLDVADVGGRYVVVSPHHEYGMTFDVVERPYCEIGPGSLAFGLLSVHTDNCDSAEEAAWRLPPGRYRVRVRIEPDPAQWLPPPLFWSVYGEPVEASTEFVVE